MLFSSLTVFRYSSQIVASLLLRHQHFVFSVANYSRNGVVSSFVLVKQTSVLRLLVSCNTPVAVVFMAFILLSDNHSIMKTLNRHLSIINHSFVCDSNMQTVKAAFNLFVLFYCVPLCPSVRSTYVIVALTPAVLVRNARALPVLCTCFDAFEKVPSRAGAF